MTLKFKQVREDYWDITVGFGDRILLGHIVKYGTTGLFKNKAPYQYEFRTTVTVVGNGRQQFGARCDTLEDVQSDARNFFNILAESIKE